MPWELSGLLMVPLSCISDMDSSGIYILVHQGLNITTFPWNGGALSSKRSRDWVREELAIIFGSYTMPWVSLKALVQKRGRGGHFRQYASAGRKPFNGTDSTSHGTSQILNICESDTTILFL